MTGFKPWISSVLFLYCFLPWKQYFCNHFIFSWRLPFHISIIRAEPMQIRKYILGWKFQSSLFVCVLVSMVSIQELTTSLTFFLWMISLFSNCFEIFILILSLLIYYFFYFVRKSMRIKDYNMCPSTLENYHSLYYYHLEPYLVSFYWNYIWFAHLFPSGPVVPSSWSLLLFTISWIFPLISLMLLYFFINNSRI